MNKYVCVINSVKTIFSLDGQSNSYRVLKAVVQGASLRLYQSLAGVGDGLLLKWVVAVSVKRYVWG